jgi:hypothetical protein
MSQSREDRERILHEILHMWEHYDVGLSARENLIELILELGYLDDVKILLQRYKRRRYR